MGRRHKLGDVSQRISGTKLLGKSSSKYARIRIFQVTLHNNNKHNNSVHTIDGSLLCPLTDLQFGALRVYVFVSSSAPSLKMLYSITVTRRDTRRPTGEGEAQLTGTFSQPRRKWSSPAGPASAQQPDCRRAGRTRSRCLLDFLTPLAHKLYHLLPCVSLQLG